MRKRFYGKYICLNSKRGAYVVDINSWIPQLESLANGNSRVKMSTRSASGNEYSRVIHITSVSNHYCVKWIVSPG